MVASRTAEERAPRVLVSVAFVAVVAIDALYLAIIRSQGGPPPDQPLIVPFVAGYLGMTGLALVLSLFVPGAPRAGLRSAAAGGLLVLAILTGFSIGVAVLVAAAFAIAATVVTVARIRSRTAAVATVAGAIIGIAILVAGLWFAWSYAG